ncbi:hypothetical protein PLICRDRAFT_442206 [Plicaturopsis crispa FD-325 SS-3]|uniref:HNH nuclease domain-containing protein n=1 Tax=Plicaturopsis crispa FD-325 SS-3 TaxID=944288 RepID=A0A0C9SQI6_PLICR|nr:hypothetical protein PLICRDRAFT_442206 [Plicaturopsis crispa FD-325 SS-3]
MILPSYSPRGIMLYSDTLTENDLQPSISTQCDHGLLQRRKLSGAQVAHTVSPLYQSGWRILCERAAISALSLESGATEPPAELAATWIFPPNLSQTVTLGPGYQDWPPDNRDFAFYSSGQNYLLLRKELVDLFQGNKFGIDVDDGYRIVAFEPLDGLRLPSHLSLPADTSARPSERLLRDHFYRCLYHNLRGGNISDNYPPEDVQEYMESLGVFDDEMDMNDPRWQTELGKAIWAALMRG